ncbi:hypothetical protein Vafri_18636 [Volvox africanus]|uniref:Uncharacterized protein n=1 Tax=Volvox africanus TaxID=51714 RepID=A0A8J4F8L3_9CHLO|nr:hypothetical protein Vafri_18636 [Volvox africanus]
MGAGAGMHPSGDGKTDDDLDVFLSDEGEQSVTVAADPDLVDTAASAHHLERAPVISAFVPMAPTTISAAAITTQSTNSKKTTPATSSIPSCVVDSGLGTSAANAVPSSSSHPDGEVIAGTITDGLAQSIPFCITAPLQASAKPPSYRCTSILEHDSPVGAGTASLPAAQDGSGPTPPVTPLCAPSRKVAPAARTSPAASSAQESAEQERSLAAVKVARRPATTGACRIRMKLHSSTPEQLRPSMLAPLAKLLLPYNWLLHGLAVRHGCLELMLDYTYLDAGAEEVQQPLDSEIDSVLTDNDAAVIGASDLQVAQLMSYLHQLGLCDPSIEPVVSVQINTQMRRVQWREHGATVIVDPHVARQHPLIVDSIAHEGQMPSPGPAVAVSAVPPEQPAWQTSGAWLCQADPTRLSVTNASLNTIPDPAPVCLVVTCSAPADEAVLYVGVSRTGLHGCTVRSLGRFLPVRELQHLSTAAVQVNAVDMAAESPTSAAAAQPAIDWTTATATAAAAGPDGEVFIVLVESLPRHSGLLQVELRIGETSDSWSAHVSLPHHAPLINGAVDSDPELPLEGSPVSPGAPPLPLTTPLQPPPRPPWAAPEYGTREVISAVAPVLLLRACTCTLARDCRCTHVRTGMVDGAASSGVTGETAHGVCTMIEASNISAELAGLRARILANCAAATVARTVAVVAAADPALAATGAHLNGQDGAEASRQFISDLGLLLDVAACSEVEMEDVSTLLDYPSYSREVQSLLRQQLGLTGSGSTSPHGEGNDGGGADVDTTAVLLRQHMADTAATLLAGCMELYLPYTARLVVSSATSRLRLCSEEVLRDAVAAGDGEMLSRLDGLFRVIGEEPSSSSLPRASEGGDSAGGRVGEGDALVSTLTTMVAQASSGSLCPPLRGRTHSSDQHCDEDVAAPAAPAPADGLRTAEPRTLLPAISTVTTSVDWSRCDHDCDSVRAPLRVCLSDGAVEQQHLNNSYPQHVLRGWVACPRGGAEASPFSRFGPFSDSGRSARGLGFHQSGCVSTAPACIDCSRLVCLEPPRVTLRDLWPVLEPSIPSPFILRLADSQPVQPVRYQRFLTGSRTADGTEVRAITSRVLQEGRGGLWHAVDAGAPGGTLAIGRAAIEGSAPAPKTVGKSIQVPKPEAIQPPGELSCRGRSCSEEVFQCLIAGADRRTGGKLLLATVAAEATATPAAALLREYGKQLLACFTGFSSPHLEQAFWFNTATRLQVMYRLYAAITIVLLSLSVARAFLKDGLAAAAFMSFYQGGQALLLAVFGLLGDGRPERLFGAVAACMVLRAVCHSLLSRGLAPLPSFVLPVCRTWADVFNEGAAKAVVEQLPAWLFMTLVVFLELPTVFALYSFLDGHGRGLLSSCLLLRLAILATLKTAVVLGTQAAWRVQFLARWAAQAKRDD